MNKNLDLIYSWSEEVPHSYFYNTRKIMDYLSSCADGKVKSILDIGCGNGHIANFLKSKGYDVVGVDYSKQAIDLAKKTYPNIPFYKIAVEDENLDNLFEKDFNLIICTEVISHIYDPAILFHVAKKNLNKDGSLIIITPYHGYLKNLAMAILGKWGNHLSPNWTGGHIKFFDINQLQELAINNGFDIQLISTIGRFKYLAKNIFLVCTPSQNILRD